MPPHYSRRSFLTGVLACGTLSASTAFLMQGRQRKITLKLATGADTTGARRDLIDRWNKKNPEVYVRYKEVTKSGTRDERDLMLDLARTGAADIVNLDIIHVAEFAARGLIDPIKISNKGEFFDTPLKAVQVFDEVNKYWAVPFNTDVGVLFTRNPDYSTQPPGLSEVLKHELEGTGDEFVGQLRLDGTTSHEPFVVNVLEHALAQKSEILDKDSGMPVYDLDMWKEALDPLKQAMGEDKIVATGTEQQSLDEFSRQQHRYMRNWPVRYRELVQPDGPDAGQIRVSGLPTGILGGAGLAIVAESGNKDKARELIDFLTDRQAQARIAKNGLVSPLKATYDDEKLKKHIPHLEVLREAVENGRFRPLHRNYLAFSQVIRDHVGPYLEDDKQLKDDFISDMRTALSG